MKKNNNFVIACLALFIVVSGVYCIYLVNNSNIPISFDYAVPGSGVSMLPERFALGSVKKDITYCGDQKLDIYQPRAKLYSTQPVVMYVHGGGWHLNNKSSDVDQRALIDGLRDKGFAIVSINYRQQPNNKFPAPVQDTLCAVRFLRAHASQYQLNPKKFAVFGYSAGGHLAAMVGVLDSNNLYNNGQYANESSRVKAVVTLAGVFDFNQSLKTNSKINIKNLMGNTPYSLGQPISYVSPDDSPFLLVHGMSDSIVMPQQDELFAQALKQNNVYYQTLQVKNAEHGLNRFGGNIMPSQADVAQTIQRFILQQMGL